MSARIALFFPDDHDGEMVAEIYFGDVFFGQVCEGRSPNEMAYEVFGSDGAVARIDLADFENALATARLKLEERRPKS